ncbi:MFS general substrate transporter [Aulographum hederae CBS 113979]|uniref:MFS general substrate transporter n=1 Tax=Aulographum hederae CBS 113979 TaxID=1176131 RepID=A0A6G1HAT6_9PEZI|nr:MFS general substrate transporter [Aulographum hederae CBS 113979]
MLDIIRDSSLGKVIRFVSQKRLLAYPEERPDFQLPSQYTVFLHSDEKSELQGVDTPLSELDDSHRNEDGAARKLEPAEDADPDLEQLASVRSMASMRTIPFSNERLHVEQVLGTEKTKSLPVMPHRTRDGVILVDWYSTDDPENPQNWSSTKKTFIVSVLAFYTFTVYCAGPIYAASVGGGLVEHFGISPVAASLGLGLYVLAYGIGDLLFSPLTEIPVIGRNPVYYLTFIVFWALSFPTAVVNSFGGLLALRFWMGFFGSPALANGGATIGDMFSLIYFPYGLSWWVLSAWFGPALGPLMGGFAAMAKGWRWPLWEVVWMSFPVVLALLCFMPETSAPTILLKRARRLRKLTGDARVQSQSEIDQRNLTASHILVSALIKPMEIMFKDPAIFFVNLYTGYFYGVFYTFFEVFPLVFPPFYGFNLGETGLAFLACLIGVTIALLGYFAYLHWYMVPDNLRNGFREQEHRLVPAILGSFLLPIGLFMFAWTSDSNIHWVVPLIAVGIFTMGHFLTMMAIFIYIPFSYPRYAASLFAGNSIWRSGIAGGSVVFARPLFVNLGVHRGVTLLGGLSVFGIIGTIAIYVFGKKLRARSKFAQS